MIFCPHYKKFQEEGVIDLVIQLNNGALPASYMVIINGVNNVYMSVRRRHEQEHRQ